MYNTTFRGVCAPWLQGKAMCITYSECVFVDLGIQNAMSMGRIFLCCLPGYTIILHIISYTARLLEKQSY
jgi:hypothetical protein